MERLYLSGDYLEEEDDEAIAALSSHSLPPTKHLAFFHHLPLSLSRSSPEGRANIRRVTSRLKARNEQAPEEPDALALRVLLCAEGVEADEDGAEEEAAWEVGSCVVPLWRPSSMLSDGHRLQVLSLAPPLPFSRALSSRVAQECCDSGILSSLHATARRASRATALCWCVVQMPLLDGLGLCVCADMI